MRDQNEPNACEEQESSCGAEVMGGLLAFLAAEEEKRKEQASDELGQDEKA